MSEISIKSCEAVNAICKLIDIPFPVQSIQLSWSVSDPLLTITVNGYLKDEPLDRLLAALKSNSP